MSVGVDVGQVFGAVIAWLSTDAARNIASLVSSLVVVGVAIFGLSRWRAQLRGTIHYEVARRCTRAILAIRDSIELCRADAVRSHELAGRTRADTESDREAEVRSSSWAYSNRLKDVWEKRTDLSQVALEAEVLWGNSIQEALKPVYQCFGKLISAYECYFDEELNEAVHGREDENPGTASFMRMREWRHVIYGRSDGKYGKELDSAIEKAIAVFKPHLK
ncbi:MAG: hypothetical protein Q8R28_20785 [Dehalococcoidia bacterium]|nr:hypothetical protein [Dehalococcoidia bacterium]